MFDLSAWLSLYHEAWTTHNAEQVAQLFTEDAIYQSHPFRPQLQGHAQIRAYWAHATASQADLDLRWGTPIVAGNRAAIEWWATMWDYEEGEVTLPGALVLRFAEDGRCEELREYWHVKAGTRLPPRATWGR